jgi:hypothetical protein
VPHLNEKSVQKYFKKRHHWGGGCKDNIKMGLKEVRCEGADWIHLALEESSGRLLRKR